MQYPWQSGLFVTCQGHPTANHPWQTCFFMICQGRAPSNHPWQSCFFTIYQGRSTLPPWQTSFFAICQGRVEIPILQSLTAPPKLLLVAQGRTPGGCRRTLSKQKRKATGIRRFLILSAQICLLDFRRMQQFLSRAFHYDSSGFHHVAAVGDG